jgi:hypothetical protein
MGDQATDQTVEVCPLRVVKQNQSSEGSSMYSLIVSSYEAEARISAFVQVGKDDWMDADIPPPLGAMRHI